MIPYVYSKIVAAASTRRGGGGGNNRRHKIRSSTPFLLVVGAAGLSCCCLVLYLGLLAPGTSLTTEYSLLGLTGGGGGGKANPSRSLLLAGSSGILRSPKFRYGVKTSNGRPGPAPSAAAKAEGGDGKSWNGKGLGVVSSPNDHRLPEKSASEGLRDFLNMVRSDGVDRGTDAGSASAATAVADNNEVFVSQIPGYRVAHLDFKGARPKLGYLKIVLPLMKRAGVNALLVEYEDSFPFSGRLANLSAANALTNDELTEFLTFATSELEMEVIPLIQTFGHLEYALKLDEFARFREVAEDPQDLCPSDPGSFGLVVEMISQVMAHHPDAKFVHVGCDEVFNLGRCDRCLAEVQASRRERGQQQQQRLQLQLPPPSATPTEEIKLFLDHVKAVSNHVRSKYDAQPLIWDDMVRKVPAKTLLASGIGDVVEPVVWVYSDDFEREFPSRLWGVYARAFPRIWSAGAFKGASGPTEYAPNVYRHVVNNLAWQRVISQEGKFFKAIRGLVFTGWSRYDHFATLCELLPNSLPSLLLNSLIISRGSSLSESTSVFHELVSCPSLVVLPQNLKELEGNPRLWQLRKCGFPGADAVELAWNYQGVKLEAEAFVRSVAVDGDAGAWVSDYNVRHNSTSRRRAAAALALLPQVGRKVDILEGDARKTLAKYLDEFAVEEWVEQRVAPLRGKLEEIRERGQRAMDVVHWKRRPDVY